MLPGIEIIFQLLEKVTQIDIQALNLPLHGAMRDQIERRLGFALSAHDDYILRIIVRLSDIHGPRGGVDKCCQIQELN